MTEYVGSCTSKDLIEIEDDDIPSNNTIIYDGEDYCSENNSDSIDQIVQQYMKNENGSFQFVISESIDEPKLDIYPGKLDKLLGRAMEQNSIQLENKRGINEILEKVLKEVLGADGLEGDIADIEPSMLENMEDIDFQLDAVPLPTINISELISEAAQVAPDSFNLAEEELKLMNFLDGNKIPKVETKNLSFSNYRLIKCTNCSKMFDSKGFQEHVCDFDENKKFISDEIKLEEPIKDPPLIIPEFLCNEPPCMRILRENQIRIRRFLKDELKYDVSGSIGSSGSIDSNLNTIGGPGSDSSSLGKMDGLHDCTICDRKFVHASGLLRHIEKHTLDTVHLPQPAHVHSNVVTNNSLSYQISTLRVVLRCVECSRVFFNPTYANEHIQVHYGEHEEDENELDIPSDTDVFDAYDHEAMTMLFEEVKESTKHNENYFNVSTPDLLKVEVMATVLQCEFCDFIFSNVESLFNHSFNHNPINRFECLMCDIHRRNAKEIFNHWQTECIFMRENAKLHNANLQRYFTCNVCNTKFQTLEQLHDHRYSFNHFLPRLNKTTGKLQLPCEFCSFISSTVADCLKHYNSKHNKKIKREREQNTISSTKYRQYLCDICGKSYTQSSHLWQHLRFHQGVKPFACKEPGCTRRFTIRPDLNDHIRKCHTGERPYHCVICGKRFLTGSVYYQHRLIHRGERRYECDECGKRFYRADALKNHQRIHTGEKPFGCHFCTKNFRQRGDRDKHIRARHSHLDENARIMMQMQKMQLEKAAAAAHSAADIGIVKDTFGSQSTNLIENVDNDGVVDSGHIIYVGNVPFPKSMFQSIMPDIDKNLEDESDDLSQVGNLTEGISKL